MATLFHLHSSGAIATPTNPAYDSGWEQTGQATRLPMDVQVLEGPLTALTTSGAITIPITTTQQICAYQHVSNQVFQPTNLDASVTFRLVINCAENATTNNAFIAYSLRAFSVDGGTLLATLTTKLASGGTEYPLTASRATRITGPIALTASIITTPFRLVLDTGCHANAPSASGSFTHRIGTGGTSNYAFTSALTTDLNTWFDLSIDLNATRMNNFQSPKSNSNTSQAGAR